MTDKASRRAVVALFLFLAAGNSNAMAEEWASRHGSCYEWQGRWTVEQERPGLWVGYIDYVHIGGNCGPGTNATVSFPVRAVIIGNDFFAYRTSGTLPCHAHGQVRAEGVSGFELCTDSAHPFALRFAPSPETPR